MPSYSVNLNAVVAQAATAVTRLQVVCAYGGSDTQVCVATTANLALAGGKLRGVALESQAAGFPIQIIDFGSVNGVLTGSGEYVSYNATGDLVRSASSGATTIGRYENGVIHVNLDYGAMGASDPATLLAGTYNPDGTGAVDSSSALAAADAAGVSGGKYVSLGPGTYKVSANITLAANWRFAPGAQLSIDSGKTVTFTGLVDAGQWQIFSGSGKASLQTSRTKYAHARWWGVKYDGRIVYSGVSISGGSTTLTGSGFTANDVGKKIVVWDRTATTASLVTTIAGYTNSTTVTLTDAAAATIPSASLPSHAPASQIGACAYGTTDDSAAWNAAVQACAGVVTLLGEPNSVTLLGSPLVLTPSTGYSPKLDGQGTVFCAIASFAANAALVTTDNGLNSNYTARYAVLKNFITECARVVDYGLLLGRTSYPSQGAAIAGDVGSITSYHSRNAGIAIIAMQSASAYSLTSSWSSNNGIEISGCNQTAFLSCKGTNALNTGKAGIVVDQHTLGSGGCRLVACGAEVNEGPGISVVDTSGARTGTTVYVDSPWCEGNGDDAVYVDREGTIIIGGVYSNTGNGVVNTQYPWRLSSTSHGSTVIGTMNVAGYQTPNLGGRVDAGCRNFSVDRARAYNTTTNANFNPSIADGWASTFTLGAAITTTVNDSRITANSIVLWTPTNAAAGTLEGSAKKLYLSARTANTSFAVTTASGVAAAGNETFQYIIVEPRP